MAKTTAPLLSFGAAGTVAKTAVFSRWRGVPYVRRHVIPANPNTAAQQSTRNVFRTMSEMWKVLGPLSVAPWDAFATGRPFVGRNAFMGQNVESLRGDADMTDFIGSPGARGGLPPDTLVATAGVGQITIDTTNPAAPTGWTLVSMIAMAFPDQDPAVAFVGPVTEGEDAVTFNQVVLTGLDTVLHQVRGWLEWTKPDGFTAYSIALADTATPT